MFRLLEAAIARFLKVPPEPHPPAGAPESVRVFRAAPGFYRYRLLSWGLGQAGAAAGLFFGIVGLRFVPEDLQWLRILELLGIAGFFLQLPFTFFLLTLDYRYRWYVVTDRSLRIRDGIWKVQERTMTFSNLQNLATRQGPLQRLFGIADLEARTAGGGGSTSGGHDQKSFTDDMHVGYFRGVDNADEIRAAIMAHLRQARAAGLGDPDEPPSAASERDAHAETLAAAREVLSETRALRLALRPSA